MKSTIIAQIGLVLLFTGIQLNVHAQKKGKSTPEKETPKDELKKISEVTKRSHKFEGLFTIYQDTIDGSIKMEVKEDQIGKEFIYFSQVDNGPVEAGGFRGSYRDSKVFKIERYFNKLEFVLQNTSSYFDPTNALSKAAEANMPNAIIASVKMEATNADKNSFLIDAGDLFLTETLSQVKPSSRPGGDPMEFSLGNLDKDKTKINRIKSYPENTDLAIEYVFSKPSVLNPGSRAITDARNVSITVYHSLIQMPDNDFQIVYDDPRVGYFTTDVTDMTVAKNANYRDLVHKWHLVKKDPSAALSDPVEPIVWWMENTTPENLRPLIKAGAEQWNIAFEKAGFTNAVVVKQQPDDATWDAGDIRYNVLRWTASPQPPFGGYGPSFVNPRTGEILGADIMFEYRSVLGNLNYEEFYSEPSNSGQMVEYSACSHAGCNMSQVAAINNNFAGMISEYIDGTQLEDSKIIKEFINYLILHEIGHTLGLNHNMKASNLHGIDVIHNAEITSKVGLIGSVMDYPSVNAALDRTKQGQYYTTRPGPYDLWAIQFAYENGRSEEETKALMSRSTEHELMFGNDADDMRAAGKGIDPHVNIYDLTSDAVKYNVERMELVKLISKELMVKYNKEGESHHDHLIAYYAMLRQYRDAANTTSRFIGGISVNRAMVGQKGETQPYTPITEAKQKEAMNVLTTYVFAPEAFTFSNDLYVYLQAQRRGFGFFARSEDPKIHEQILAIQKGVIDQLLHENTLERIVDSELYGNEYTLTEVMTELTNAIFKADIAGNVTSVRQNLQITYTEKLIDILIGKSKDRYNNTAQSHALYFLKEVQKMASTSTGDISTKAHKSHLKTIIENALTDVK
jgi:hypothetical protein